MGSREDDEYFNQKYGCDCDECLYSYCEYCGGELDDFGDCRSDECEESDDED
jgi:hypothetical protein